MSGQAHYRYHSVITTREREVIALIALGYSNAEIGVILYITMETVKSHVRTALAKMRCRTRAELVYRAIQDGVLHVAPSREEPWSPSPHSRGGLGNEWNGIPEELLRILSKD